MELNLKLNVRLPISEVALTQFYHWASVLETGEQSPDAFTADTIKENEKSSSNDWVEVDPMKRFRQHDREEVAEDDPASSPETTIEDEVAEVESASAGTVVKKRGRKPRVAITADLPAAPEAAKPAASLPPPLPFPVAAAPVAAPPSPPPSPPTGAVPPWLAQQPAPVQPTPVQPTPPAMPSTAAYTNGAGGEMPLDEFRAACFEMQKASPGLPFRVMRATVWADDDTPKGWSSMTAENVPPAERRRMVQAMEGSLLRS